MTAISNNDIARAIYLISKDQNHAEQAALSDKVVQFLFKKRMFSAAPDVLSKLANIVNKNENRIVADVSSPEQIDHKTSLHIKHFLKEKYKAEEVILNEHTNKDLIGGLKIEVNDEVIDMTMKNRINKLQAYLTKD